MSTVPRRNHASTSAATTTAERRRRRQPHEDDGGGVDGSDDKQPPQPDRIDGRTRRHGHSASRRSHSRALAETAEDARTRLVDRLFSAQHTRTRARTLTHTHARRNGALAAAGNKVYIVVYICTLSIIYHTRVWRLALLFGMNYSGEPKRWCVSRLTCVCVRRPNNSPPAASDPSASATTIKPKPNYTNNNRPEAPHKQAPPREKVWIRVHNTLL